MFPAPLRPVLRFWLHSGQFCNASSVHSWVLLLDHSAVAQTDFAPAAVQRARSEGRLGGFLLVDLNAPAGLLADPQVAVVHLRAALKNGLGSLVEGRVLLDAEVITD